MDEQSLSIKTSSINHATPCFKMLQNYSVSNSDKKCLLVLPKALSDLNFHAKNVKTAKNGKNSLTLLLNCASSQSVSQRDK